MMVLEFRLNNSISGKEHLEKTAVVEALICCSPWSPVQYCWLMPSTHFDSLPGYFIAHTTLTFSELILAQDNIFHVFFIRSILHSCMLTEEDRNVYWLSYAKENEGSFCNMALNWGGATRRQFPVMSLMTNCRSVACNRNTDQRFFSKRVACIHWLN